MYMKVNKGQNTYNVEAYDRSDRLKMKGRSLDPKGQVWHGSFEFYHPNGKIESKGQYLDGAKVGIWERFDMNGKPLAERMYAAFDPKNMAYIYVDQMPRFDGGEKKFSEFLKHKWMDLVNDGVFLEKGGQIELSFIVTERGSIENLELTKGISAEWDAKALNLLTVLPDWIPGKNQGENVRVGVSLLIEL
jgi:hypothetical protein